MLSERIIKDIGIRIKLMSLTCATIFSWDRKSKRIVLSSNYLYWNWVVCLAGGFNICFVQALQIYLKLSYKDIPDVAPDPSARSRDSEFVTLVLTWGEMIVIITICLLATQVKKHRSDIMYLMNEMITYHEQVMLFYRERDLEVDDAHLKAVRQGEFILKVAAYFSYILPILIMMVFFHPLEPVHNILLEWMEYEVSLENLSPFHILFFPAMMVALNCSGNTIVVLALFVCCNYLISTITLQDMTPTVVDRCFLGRRHKLVLVTEYYGVMEDEEIIFRYRTLQLFNTLLNEIMAAVRVSLQTVACLAAAAIMGYFVIKFNDVIWETGFAGCVVVLGALAAGFVIQWYESVILGTLVEISEDFRDRGRRLVGRKTLYHKFCASCITFYIQEAYPFFTIDRGTFLEFCDQALDKMITLLLW